MVHTRRIRAHASAVSIRPSSATAMSESVGTGVAIAAGAIGRAAATMFKEQSPGSDGITYVPACGSVRLPPQPLALLSAMAVLR